MSEKTIEDSLESIAGATWRGSQGLSLVWGGPARIGSLGMERLAPVWR